MFFADEDTVNGTDGNNGGPCCRDGSFSFKTELAGDAPDGEGTQRALRCFSTYESSQFHESLIVGTGLTVGKHASSLLANERGGGIFFDGGIHVEKS